MENYDVFCGCKSKDIWKIISSDLIYLVVTDLDLDYFYDQEDGIYQKHIIYLKIHIRDID